MHTASIITGRNGVDRARAIFPVRGFGDRCLLVPHRREQNFFSFGMLVQDRPRAFPNPLAPSGAMVAV